MTIDTKNLKEVNIPHIKRIAQDERFYAVPNATDYALSDYGRLFYQTHNVKIKYIPGYEYTCEYYPIKFDDSECKVFVRIDNLIKMVFRPNEDIGFLISTHFSDEKLRWKVADLHILKNATEYGEYIRSKIEHDVPNYAGYHEKHGFINRREHKMGIHKTISRVYSNMKCRTMNEGVKIRNPQYKDAQMCDEWLHDIGSFYDWYLENDYDYPGRLELDKDILCFGTSKIYSPDKCCLVPPYINKLFEHGKGNLGLKVWARKRADGTNSFVVEGKNQKTFHNYFDALNYAREEKANEIRDVVRREREKGYMPEYILAAMSKWADLAEMGLIKMWEPKIESLIEEGVI